MVIIYRSERENEIHKKVKKDIGSSTNTTFSQERYKYTNYNRVDQNYAEKEWERQREENIRMEFEGNDSGEGVFVFFKLLFTKEGHKFLVFAFGATFWLLWSVFSVLFSNTIFTPQFASLIIGGGIATNWVLSYFNVFRFSTNNVSYYCIKVSF